jgi:flagellar hook assembly protein FlgD
MFTSLKLRRALSTLLMSVFALSLFSFAPLASAANPLIQNVNVGLDPFHISIPGQSAVLAIDYDYNTGGYPTGAVLEQIRNENDEVVYEFGNFGTDDKVTGHYQLVWDGTYKNGGSNDGEYVSDGTYKIYLYSLTPTPPAAEYEQTFEVEHTVAPQVTLLSDSPAVYYTPSGNFNLNYNLELNSASTSVVRLEIEGPLNNNPQQTLTAQIQGADGNYVIHWDGLIMGNTADPGQYSYKLQVEGSVDGFGVLSNEITGQFTVSDQQNPQPTLDDLSVTPDPYNPNAGMATFSYTLVGSLGYTTIQAEVFSSAAPGVALKTWSFSGQSNGSNSVSWNGKNANEEVVSNGSYVLKVSGSDGNFTLVPQQVSFTIAAAAEPQPPVGNQCAGYTDVPASHPDCDAIEYVQSIGAMTGHPDGTFRTDEILQRDQVAKISLETFDLFNDAVDHCNGTPAFPDVPSTQWSFQYICRGVGLGMITGYLSGADAGFYRPARSVNRVEFLALILRNLTDTMPSVNSTSYNDVAAGQWYSGYAKYSYDHSLFVGVNLNPTQFVTRLEVAQVLYKLHQLGKI